MSKTNEQRKGCKDIWNAFMCKGAKFGLYDIPLCPTTARTVPKSIVTWDEAKAIHKKNSHTNNDYRMDDYVCWYMDDYKFDGSKGIWNDCKKALDVLRHFSGVITPDFSTYQDFPEPLKIYNTYRMRAYGYWLGRKGISVINNIRWGTYETYRYCFEGVEKNSVVAIGTCGGSPRKKEDRLRFEQGLDKLINVLSPHTIIVYGSANYSCFEALQKRDIRIIAFKSKTAQAYEKRKKI